MSTYSGFSRDGNKICAGNGERSANGKFNREKLKTGRQLFTWEGHKFDVDGLVLARDNRYLLTGSVDRPSSSGT